MPTTHVIPAVTMTAEAFTHVSAAYGLLDEAYGLLAQLERTPAVTRHLAEVSATVDWLGDLEDDDTIAVAGGVR